MTDMDLTMNRLGFENTRFFLGQEVERTPAFGKETLFVVGVQPTADIESVLSRHLETSYSEIQHIFFGANHSFDPHDAEEYAAWENMISHFLKKNLLCSLDIPTTALEEFNEGALCEYNNFIPQIRIAVPYVRLWNYNTMIKIDDRDFDSTNPGVWCHRLHDLMSTDTFTPWNHYNKDRPTQ